MVNISRYIFANVCACACFIYVSRRFVSNFCIAVVLGSTRLWGLIKSDTANPNFGLLEKYIVSQVTISVPYRKL